VPLGLLIWLPSGPLAAGWAKTAGTPASLITAASSGNGSSTGASGTGSGNSGASSSGSSSTSSFSAEASGTVKQGSLGDGLARVDITLSLAGQQLDKLAIDLRGQPIDGGGIEMTSSDVTLGSQSNPGEYRGHVTSLQGTNIAAQVSDGSGHQLGVVARLDIDPNTGAASGTVNVTP
jgi:hypothetical protein